MRYRIKQVTFPRITDDTLIYYYPQIQIRTTRTVGHFWWKKEIEELKWINFFSDTKGKDAYLWLREINGTTLVFCETLESAQNVIDQHKKQQREYFEKKCVHLGVAIDDSESTVKIHNYEEEEGARIKAQG